MKRYLRFLGQFLGNPQQVGAIAPSSSSLARAITSCVGLGGADVVVELGPGDGAFTSFIRSGLKPGAVFFALDANESMCARLRTRFPELPVYCDSAVRLCDYLGRHGVRHADCIVSGLPWASFGAHLQDELMTAVHRALRPGGEFATFAYLQGLILPSGQRFRRRLCATFGKVSRSRVVWRNLPPAFVYRCVKP